MICSNCGKNISDGSKFCGNCGGKVETKQFCTSCGTERREGQLFCSVCGLKFDSHVSDDNQFPQRNGQLLMTLNLVSLYEGEPTLGVAKATGKLSVYDDRLELKKQMGNSLGSAFGLIGMAAARKSTKNDPVDSYPLAEISTFKVGKYGGVYNTLVLTFKNGKTISLCPAIPGSSDPQNIIEKLRPYL